MSLAIDLNDLVLPLTGDIAIVNDIFEAVLTPSQFDFVLEAGCGSGKLGLNIAMRTQATVFLMDYDPMVKEKVSRLIRAAESILGQRLPIVIKQGDINDIPYCDDTFDLVFNEGVLEHFADPVPVIREMMRVSKDSVVAIVPHALNEMQMELAKSQTAQYAGKDHWAAYEAPMTQEQAAKYFTDAGLTNVITKLVWPQGKSADPSDYRMVLAGGRKYE